VHWAVWEFEKELGRREAEGLRRRPLEIIPIEGANHFFHWDDPERALKVFTDNHDSW